MSSRIRAERQAGELLRDLKESGGRQRQGDKYQAWGDVIRRDIPPTRTLPSFWG